MADNVDITPGTGKTVAADDVGGVLYQRVKIGVGADGSATDVSSAAPLPITAAGGTMAVYFDQSNPSVNVGTPTVAAITASVNVLLKPGTIAVQLDPGHTLGAISSLGGSVAVYFDQSAPTVKAIPSTGTFTVQFDPGHELGTIKGNSNTLTVFLPDTGHEIGTIRGNTNTLTVFIPDTGHTIGKVDAGTGTFTVKFDPGYELGSIKGVNSSVNVLLKPGTLAISLDPGYTLGKVDQGNATTSGTQGWLVNTQGTASVFTASGSVSGVSASGNTIISPSANASFKIYAFSLQTTGIVSLTAKFTNGSGGSPTEFWRPLVTSNQTTSTPIGANLATGGPGNPLFVTGTSTTLALVLDTATLVHYSISYTKESA